MTYKEKVKELYPECVDDSYAGGVAGCPGDYFKNAFNDMSDECYLPSANKTHHRCILCWNRMYRNEKVLSYHQCETCKYGNDGICQQISCEDCPHWLQRGEGLGHYCRCTEIERTGEECPYWEQLEE